MEQEAQNGQQQGQHQKQFQFDVVRDDPYLVPYTQHFTYVHEKYQEKLSEILKHEGSLVEFGNSYKTRGIHQEKDQIVYREWAPFAEELYLTGDFCNWERQQFKGTCDNFGNWEVIIPNTKDGKPRIEHNSKVKAHIKSKDGCYHDRIPAYMQFSSQNEQSKSYDGVFWNPPKKYEFKFPKPQIPKNDPQTLRIYECHIGMAGIHQRVHSYLEFKNDVLPRIKNLGYNVIQIMAIAEHAYYGSFGYHVTLPFAVSNKYGTPDEFKEMIDCAHELGLKVLIDLVHSHASSNTNDGINQWDGSQHHYFHEGALGYHTLWDSRLYNYAQYETLRYLISNVAYFMNEFNIDGFRFDGITSMLYKHHGIAYGFTGNYEEYFNHNLDIDSVIYLMLVNELIHTINPQAISIAEDVSGYPSLGRKISEGGVGFDYRLAMAIPDKWIKLLKEQSDDDWDMTEIVHQLTNRRYREPVICYAESHDQALVGDKTLSQQLFDIQIYTNMSKSVLESITTFRAMALHKMIRLITFALGGEGYLNFMGNEFGHPEWIDFPREGNNWSYHYCRRRWDLADDDTLKFKFLNTFDKDMVHLDVQYNILNCGQTYISEKNQGNKVIIFERGSLLFIFNFHPTESYVSYKIPSHIMNDHQLILDSDRWMYGGHSRLEEAYKQNYKSQNEQYNNRPNCIYAYLPNRCVLVLKGVDQ